MIYENRNLILKIVENKIPEESLVWPIISFSILFISEMASQSNPDSNDNKGHEGLKSGKYQNMERPKTTYNHLHGTWWF